MPDDAVGDGGIAPTTERPIENLKGEFDRKIGSLQGDVHRLTTAVSAMLEQQQAPRQDTPKASGDHSKLTNDELWDLAKSGDKSAFDLHQKRLAADTYQQMRGQERHTDLVEGQLQILNGKYRVLANKDHALSQTRDAAYALLTRRGYPANAATFLEATKTAIADRPDLVSEIYTQGDRAREGARRVSASNTGVTGATVRQDEPNTSKIRVSPEQSAIARRMNVADPAKAIANHLKRQESGESKFGAVGAQLQNGTEF